MCTLVKYRHIPGWAWDLQNLSVAENANICPDLTINATKSVRFRVIYRGRCGYGEKCSRRNEDSLCWRIIT